MVLWHYSTIDIIALWNYSSIYIYGTMVLWYYHPNGSMRVYGSILNLVFLMMVLQDYSSTGLWHYSAIVL